ncbi:hypothetical protein BJY21_000896 [Kineosphaera limosa]|uniref:YokE-like PH domain-containing protein n=1 Tax=Kineosphaera limosa NBRC 100340 TaxID=1184609 RepID=K6WGA1_9MICO|nr:hypothetical protein [Kineosphaera limosa]NYD99711.1 hypothetical protein [Kineosphaera limosa]GAB98285.1 hypothetical protein KILIM_122_00020 [Kineosphaera limosa NBRC 100340]
MVVLRRDIAEAVSRMSVTFGIRSAVRNLHESLEEGELVQALVACFYSGSDGLLVLTDRRVIALRDDFSKFRLQAVPLRDIRALDYAPAIHDGLAVLTATGRVAVRKMNRADSDSFAAAVVAAVPGVIVGASRPHQAFRPDAGQGDHAADSAAHGVAALGAGSSPVSGPRAGSGAESAPQADPLAAARDQGAVAGAAVAAASGAPNDDGAATGGSTPSGRAASSEADGGEADKDVLLGVLADLHAKGLLTADELATKIAQVTAAP